LTEYFRNAESVSRTAHPIFSVAIWGKRKGDYMEVGMDSFGDDSIFAKLHQNDGKIVIFGSPFITSCTFIHYIEQKHGVPYRYFKTFTGMIRDKHGETSEECTYYVRYLDRDVNLDTRRLEQDLIEKGLMKEKKLGNGRVMVIRAADFFYEGNKLLDKDITYFLDGSYRDENIY
jgi:aminoglycoside 3-N-acetyltransferase